MATTVNTQTHIPNHTHNQPLENDFVMIPSKAQEEMQKTMTLCHVLRNNAKEGGIFRLRGNDKNIQAFSSLEGVAYNNGIPHSLRNHIISIHDVSGILKKQIKEEPIFTEEQLEHLDRLMDTSKRIDPNTSEQERKEIEEAVAKATINYITTTTSPENLMRLGKVIEVVGEVLSHSDENKMSLSNLNTSLGPTLLLPTDHIDVATGARIRSGKEEYKRPTGDEATQTLRVSGERGEKNLRLMNILVNHFVPRQ
ncbi:MAG: hypothetical protein H7A38_03440 [Chlamydiales bacterium]|nr:hypothetical protein [Chlamydiales bacterium]